MYLARTLRLSAASVAAVVALGTVGALPAEAGKPAPAPTGITASATEPAIGSYDVTVTWNAVTGAAQYQATITRSGSTTVLASDTVNGTTWHATVAGVPGQQLSISVRAVVGTRKGKPGAKTLNLTDQIAPTASYTSDSNTNTGQATLVESGLQDDSPLTGVTRTVDWGDGTSKSYAANVPITHTYALSPARYVPHVTLKDVAGHTSQTDSTGVVVQDTLAPTGTFSVSPAAAWSAFTTVTVTQQGDLSDNWTPAGLITRSVAWGDGTTDVWTTGATVTHTYATAGSYTPVVTITDEADNANPVSTSEVVVTADTAAPAVKLTLPKSKNSVRAWKTLRGTAVDAETGLKSVWLKAVEKRGAAWYGYNAATHVWAKAATKTKAFTKAKAFSLTTNVANQWTAKLVKLRKGTLVYKVRATDQVNNRSATVTHTARLTRR
jgi:hypothetical protein